MPSINIPPKIKLYGVKGIFVGGCVERGDGSRFRAKAHAHTSKIDKYKGWICFLSAKRLYTQHWKPSRLMWHEAAHIHRPSWNHKKVNKWANKMEYHNRFIESL